VGEALSTVTLEAREVRPAALLGLDISPPAAVYPATLVLQSRQVPPQASPAPLTGSNASLRGGGWFLSREAPGKVVAMR
jgi:hypothetical protein